MPLAPGTRNLNQGSPRDPEAMVCELTLVVGRHRSVVPAGVEGGGHEDGVIDGQVTTL